MAAQVETTQQQGGGGGGGADVSLTAGDPSQTHNDVNCEDSAEEIEKTRTLICALNFLSRNLPLPQDVFDAVSSIYHDDGDNNGDADAAAEDDVAECEVNNPNDVSNVVGGGGVGSAAVAAESSTVKDGSGMASYGDLMADFEVAVLKQRQSCMSGSGLAEIKENRFQSHIQHRLAELEELPAGRGEDLQSRCLLELYGLKLSDLQKKVRSEVSAEYWLRLHCTNPENQLFDWGMMRLHRPLYGIGDAFAIDAEDPLKKKREVERWSRFEEERRIFEEAALRKFSADLMNAFRELQLQVQAAQKRRKQRNDGVQAWHGKQRQRASRAEKLRFQALKNDDQEAYMKMVKESKNERLTMLLGKTNDLLVCLGAAVQRQKDAEHEGIEPSEGSDVGFSELTSSKTETPGQSFTEEGKDIIDNESNSNIKKGDLLEGWRQYNSVVHSIEEKVTA